MRDHPRRVASIQRFFDPASILRCIRLRADAEGTANGDSHHGISIFLLGGFYEPGESCRWIFRNTQAVLIRVSNKKLAYGIALIGGSAPCWIALAGVIGQVRVIPCDHRQLFPFLELRG